MSSPLDARIRNLAREEASAVFLEGVDASGDVNVGNADPVAELKQQLAELTARVEALEKTPAAARRAPRKSPESGE